MNANEHFSKGKGKEIPVQVCYRPRGFQEAEVFGSQDNRYMTVVRSSPVNSGFLYAPGNIPGTHVC